MACNSTQKTVPEPKATSTAVVAPTAETYAATVTEEDLKKHLFTYASDEFEGRETGQPGQKKAIAYLKEHYQKLGVPAAKGGDDYFQKVPLELKNLPTGTVMIGGKEIVLGEHILSFREAIGKVDQLVYVGYGIEEGTYSDYEGIDVKGKWVLMKGGEPMTADSTFTLSGTKEASKWSNISEGPGLREELANEKGVMGIIYFDEANFSRYKRYYDYMKTNDGGQMSFKSEESRAAMLVADSEIATKLYADISEDDTPKVIPITFDANLVAANTPVDTENVAAIIKGSEKPEEYVIISSHLDHIGITADGQINNGADDDGSGSVALLEIAEAFKKAADAGNGPKRSIVFLHVTGEEKGLLGSQYYTDNDPIFPLAQTVANLNIDMIGRIDPKREGDRNYIYLIGSDKLSTDLHELSEEVNEKYMNIELDYTYNDENDPNRFYYRSDHYNFAKNNIPIIFYFNGTHDDYHKPGDTPDKINYDLLENRTRLVFHTAWEVANRDARVIVDKAGK